MQDLASVSGIHLGAYHPNLLMSSVMFPKIQNWDLLKTGVKRGTQNNDFACILNPFNAWW